MEKTDKNKKTTKIKKSGSKEKVKKQRDPKEKLKVHWSDSDGDALVEIIPTVYTSDSESEKEEITDEEYQSDTDTDSDDEEIEYDSDEEVPLTVISLDGTIPKIKKKKGKDPCEWTQDEFKGRISSMNDKNVTSMMEEVLNEYDQEKILKDLLLQLIKENPKEYLKKLTDISDFDMAKFGFFHKMKTLFSNLESQDLWDICNVV